MEALQDTFQSSPNLACRIVRCLLVTFERLHGADRLRQVLRGSTLPRHIDYDFLAKQDNWLSIEAAQVLLDALCNASDRPQFARMAGRNTFTREVLEFDYTILRAFGHPALGYDAVVSRASTYNHAGTFTLTREGKYRLELVYKPHKRELNNRFCSLRTGQFEAIPRVWGLPLAQVHETSCSAEGADACCYKIAWTQHLGLRSAFGIALAGSAALFAGLRLGVPNLNVAWATASAFATAFVAYALQARYALVERDALLGAQNQDLLESMSRLQDAQRTLEERIQARTNDLEATKKQLEVSLATAGKDAEAKSRFVAGISHELRTPLTLLLMAASELEKHPHDLDPLHEIGEIQRQGLLLFRYVEHLLEYAAIEAGASRLNLEQGNLGACVEQWVQDSRARAVAQGLSLVVEKQDPIPDSTFDAEKVHSAFINLVGNALKFTNKGRITCRVFQDDKNIVLEVQDTGRGIPPESLPHVFERFYQAEVGGERHYGTGLGLTIAKENVDLHKGSMTVSSVLDQGTTFRITLPIDPEVTERRQRSRRREDRARFLDGHFATSQQSFRKVSVLADLQARDGQGTPTAKVAVHGVPKDAPRVLVVEDNAGLRAHTVKMLRRHFHVVEAEDGKTGLQAAKDNLPDVIVSDVQMPNMAGHAFCVEVRKVAALNAVPFIFVSADNSAQSKFSGFAAGAVDYITKPFDPDELVARIQAQWRMRQALVAFEERNTRLAAIGQTCAQIVHDLRSPLQSILSDVQFCSTVAKDIPAANSQEAKEKLSAELQEVFTSLDEGVRRGNRMLDNVLAFVRTGVESLNKRPVALKDWLLDVVSGLTPYLEAADIAVHVEAPPQRIEFLCDPEQLRRALENILRNAREALAGAKQAGEKHVWVRLWAESESIYLRVADNGDGIPAAIRESLGKAYITQGKVGGTGLGLAVTWNVVAAHNGQITIEPAPPEQGAAFLIKFPFVAAKALGNT